MNTAKDYKKHGDLMENKIIIICHDEYAQTWDILYLNRINSKTAKFNYIDSIDDHCDYERYHDTDIINLTKKIEKDWDNVKEKINYIIENNSYDLAYHMDGFCLIVEKVIK